MKHLMLVAKVAACFVMAFVIVIPAHAQCCMKGGSQQGGRGQNPFGQGGGMQMPFGQAVNMQNPLGQANVMQMPFPQGTATLALLKQIPIQKDLQLSSAQNKKLKSFIAKEQKDLQALVRIMPMHRQQKADEMNQANEESLQELLTQDQSNRLTQIALQKKGAVSLSDSEIVSALKISYDQQGKLKAVQQESAKETTKLQQMSANPQYYQSRMPDIKKRWEKLQKDTQEKLLNVLTVEQRNQWQEMIGEPFPRKSV
jgi:CRISPR/Cas system-associated endoribonuclease Cas2